jgi:hypothetical protein
MLSNERHAEHGASADSLRSPLSFETFGPGRVLTAVAKVLAAAFALACSAAHPVPTANPPASAASPPGSQPLSIGRAIPVKETSIVTVDGAFYVDFPQGPSAVVINYETTIAIENMSALAAEADELMKFFQSDIEAVGVRSAVFRAAHYEGSGALRQGQGYGFMYEKGPGGLWTCSPQEAH